MTLVATAQLAQQVASGKELQIQSCPVGGGTLYVSTVREGGQDIVGVASTYVPSSTNSTRRMRLTEGKNITGAALAAAAAAGVFGHAITLGTSAQLVSEVANNNTKTDVVMFEGVMSDAYVAAANFQVVVNANFVLGGGTLTAKTVAVAFYRDADAGTEGATIETTSAQTITGTAADYTFAVTGATMNPGDRWHMTVTMVLTETASSNVTGNINSVRLTNA